MIEGERLPMDEVEQALAALKRDPGSLEERAAKLDEIQRLFWATVHRISDARRYKDGHAPNDSYRPKV